MNNSKYDFDFRISLGPRSLEVAVESSSPTVALRAPSGSGKTAFIRTIAGINRKYTGRLFLKARTIGYVPQDACLIPHLSVEQNLLLSPRADAGDLPKIADRLGLSELLPRQPRLLSGGEKQRVSIGRALISLPDLLVLDEPFSALDADLRKETASFIKQWIEDRKTDLILVTHDAASSNFLCEETWTIKSGKLTSDTSPSSFH